MRSTAFAVALGAAFLAWSGVALADPDCRASPALLELGHPLSAARQAIEQRHELRIVAMGSSSTQGYGVSQPQFAYPAQLQLRLEEALPGVTVRVINKGVGGQDAREQVDRMRADVEPQHAQLVIWQAGTNSHIRNDSPTQFADRLRMGIDTSRALGADVVLMNPQYVPAVVDRPRGEDYRRAMTEVAKEKGAGLFNRFDIMRAWRESGVPYSKFVIEDNLHLNDFGQKCTARLLSAALVRELAAPQSRTVPVAGK